MRDAASLERAAAVLGRDVEVDVEALRVSAPVADRMAVLGAVVRELGDGAEDVTLRRPTLDEVFLELTAPAAPRAATSGLPA